MAETKKKKKNWVDFKEVKEQVCLEMILQHYKIFNDLKPSGQNLVSCCPIHKGANPRQFSVNLERNLWNCFGNCKAGGNAIDLVAMMEFGNKNSGSIRKAGLLMKKLFLTGHKNLSNEKSKSYKPVENQGQPENIPLDFKLKNLETTHPFFDEKLISEKTIKHFDLGFCKQGLMKNRIVIPVHNEKNQLIAYCGRAATQEQIDEKGKYKQPPNFYKSAVVYNLHRQPGTIKLLILVESFISVWKAYQAGFSNVVALMGSQLSDQQEDLIVNHFSNTGGVLLLFDDDEDGQKCTNDCLVRLGKKLFVKALDVSPFAKKPHLLTPDQFKELI